MISLQVVWGGVPSRPMVVESGCIVVQGRLLSKDLAGFTVFGVLYNNYV